MCCWLLRMLKMCCCHIEGFLTRQIFHVTDETFDQCAASTCYHVRVASNVVTLLGILLVTIVIGKNLSNGIDSSYFAEQMESYIVIFAYMILFILLAISIGLLFQVSDFPVFSRDAMDQAESFKSIMRMLKKKQAPPFNKKVHGFNLMMHTMHLVSLGSTAVNLALIMIELVLLLLHQDPIFSLEIFFCWILAILCLSVVDLYFSRTNSKGILSATFLEVLQGPNRNSFSALLPCLGLSSWDILLVKIGCTILNEVSQLNSKVLRTFRRMAAMDANTIVVLISACT